MYRDLYLRMHCSKNGLFDYLVGARVRFGSKADIAAPPTNVCFSPIADIGTQSWNVRFVPKADICGAAKKTHHSINSSGAVEQLWPDGQAESLCGL